MGPLIPLVAGVAAAGGLALGLKKVAKDGADSKNYNSAKRDAIADGQTILPKADWLKDQKGKKK